jgi:hypothetical protein
MIHPFLENTTKTIQYVFLWLAYAILQTVVFVSLLALPFWIIMLDGLVHAAVFGVLGLLLWSIVKYGNYSILNVFQRSVNYVAIGIIAIGIWLSSGYGLFYLLFGAETSSQFIALLPIRGFIGLLVYLLIIQRFSFALLQPKIGNETDDEIIQVDENASKKNPQIELLERIAVKSGTKIHVVLIPEIIYIQADGDYVMIFTTNGKYLKEQTMKYFEENLPQLQFVRVHRSIIVNVEMISRIELYEKQNQLLTLKNGQQIKTSPAGYKSLRAALKL